MLYLIAQENKDRMLQLVLGPEKMHCVSPESSIKKWVLHVNWKHLVKAQK